MLGVLGWILFGLVVGIIAKLLMPGKDPGGFLITMMLGIAGAVLGGAAGRMIGLYGPAVIRAVSSLPRSSVSLARWSAVFSAGRSAFTALASRRVF